MHVISYFECTASILFSSYHPNINPLSANSTKWSNTLKRFVGKLSTNCLSVFDHFMGLALNKINKINLRKVKQNPKPSFPYLQINEICLKTRNSHKQLYRKLLRSTSFRPKIYHSYATAVLRDIWKHSDKIVISWTIITEHAVDL